MVQRRQRVDDRAPRPRRPARRRPRGSRSGSRSRRGSARGRAPCRRSTRRARAAVRRRAGRSASRPARRRRPRRRSASWSRASRRRAPRCGRPASPAPAPSPPPGFQLERQLEQLAELERAQLFACEEVLLQAGNTKRVPKLTAIAWNLFHGRDFPPDPRLLTWRSRLLRITERNATHAQVNRDLVEEFGSVLSRGELGRRPAAGEPAALCRAAGAGLRRRTPPRPHLPQRPRRPARRGGAPQPRPDRLRRGRLQPDPGAGGRRARADRGEAGADDPRGQARAPGDGPDPHRLGGLHRQPARLDQRAGAGDRGRALRRAGGDRVGGRLAAPLRRRPQPAPAPELRRPSSSSPSASAWAPRPGPTRSTTCWCAAWSSSPLPPSGRPSDAR